MSINERVDGRGLEPYGPTDANEGKVSPAHEASDGVDGHPETVGRVPVTKERVRDSLGLFLHGSMMTASAAFVNMLWPQRDEGDTRCSGYAQKGFL